MVTSAGAYRPYEDIVSAATAEMGLPPAKNKELLQRWSELEAFIETCSQRSMLSGVPAIDWRW
jgi:hypothetical protein